MHSLWKDPKNWTRLGFYRCKEDPRIFVPKKTPWTGWTLNVAHPKAIPALFLLSLVGSGPSILAVAMGVRDIGVIFGVVAGSILGMLLLVFYLSRPPPRD